jgi:hypothetical protein
VPTATTIAPAPLAYHLARRRFDHRLRALEALARYLGPTPGHCPRCKQPVVIVSVGAWPDALAVEPAPVLELHECALCRQVRRMGHTRRRVCPRCRGAGVLGEPLTGIRGVAIDPQGLSRLVVGERAEGEALHRTHVCA